jgi:hypothetical protein
MLMTARVVPVSDHAPTAWPALDGQLTPRRTPATYRSGPHAAMGLRVAYRQFVLGEPASMLDEIADLYQSSWDRVVRHVAIVRRIIDMIEADEIPAAATLWTAIDQPGVDAAFRVVLGEREPHAGKNLVTHVWTHYGLRPLPYIPEHGVVLARKGTTRDNNHAWGAPDTGCATGAGC